MPDVVIVGGGPIGLASAWRAAQAGLTVTVCDPSPGGGAADVSAGMLAAVAETWFGEEEMTALTVDSANRWPLFAKELEAASDVQIGFRQGGTLIVAYDSDDLAAVGRLIALQHDLGLDVQRLRSSQLRQREPGLAPRVRGGALAGSDHRVDPRLLCQALLAASETAGVEVRRDTVATIEVDRGRIVGVVTEAGARVAAPAVVLAAGCWSSAISGLPAEAVPAVRPVKGETVTLRCPDGAAPPLDHTVRAHVRGSYVYLVPRDDGRLVIGATVDERGFDTTVAAGSVYRLLRDATTLVPGVDELAVIEVRAGLRPGTPDNVPIIGAAGVEGLVLATGHYRNGILMTPITAEAVTALLTGTATPEVVAPCDPGRFS